MLQLTFSNRFEVLLDRLIGQLAAERPGPFEAQQVIVPSAGLARRIELRIASDAGICANVEFAYLAQWLWRQMRLVLPEVREESPFAPEALAWRVYEMLGDATFADRHARLKSYLAGADAVMRLDLAGRIAQLVEQYITYRADFLENWSAGRRAPLADLHGSARDDEAWQADLWRRIAIALGAAKEHPSVTFFRRLEAMPHDAAFAAALPRAAHVFCLPAMPPLHLATLRRLAHWMELHLYVVNPCEEYWFDIVPAKRLAWLAARGKGEKREVLNALLASWGGEAQAHNHLLHAGDGEFEEADASFAPADGSTLLAQVQESIRTLDEAKPGRFTLPADDRSIEVHVCHSLARELEVLQDQLLARFAAPDPPRAEDILVVTPDLDAAAPVIDAVFGTARNGRRIDYAISGQPQRRVNPIARAVDTVLALASGRHVAGELMDLLQQAPVARRFGLDAAGLESVHGWLRDAGVRWGLDASSRLALELPETDHHTLADGLHRLYLAYAMGSAGACIDGRIGAGNPEGQEAAALGGLWRYFDALRRTRDEWQRPKAAADWRASLTNALERFIADSPDWAEELREVRRAIAELERNMARGELSIAVPLDVVREALAGLLDDPARGAVPSGRVTFATMSGLRYLPYRIVCAIGLNDGAFPAPARPLEFDLMALAPRLGDRQRRVDDRNLFLDLLLAARERLYLSYTGRSVRDDSPMPPSVLVAELLDFIVRGVGGGAERAKAVRKQLVAEHPLQPFAETYFLPASPSRDARIVSFNAQYCEALRHKFAASTLGAAPMALQSAKEPASAEEADEDSPVREPMAPFFAAPLAPPGAEWRTVRLDQLVRFFSQPSRYLLQVRLGVRLPEPEEELENDEPFLPDYRARQALARRLLPLAIEDASGATLRELALAGTEFPAGALGETAIDAELRELQRFVAALREDLPAEPLTLAASVDHSLDGEAWRLEGALAGVREGALVRWRYDEARPRDYLAAWIEHLFLCAARSGDAAFETRWHARDGIIRLRFCAEARQRLEELLALYREGLCAPLHFFPKSAWAFASSDWKEAKAQSKWKSEHGKAFPESEEPAYQLALRGTDFALDERFFEIARQIFEPLLAHLQEASP